MSIDQSKAIVERFVREVLAEGRREVIDELVGSDFRSHTWSAEGSDRDDLRRAMDRMASALSDVRFTIEDVIAEGDRVAVRLTASATQTGELMGMPPTGRRYTIGEIHIFRVTDGRIVEHWHQHDQAGLMRQLQG